MPNIVKHRKERPVTDALKPCGGNEVRKGGEPCGKFREQCCSVDIRTVVSVLSLSSCCLLAWALLQQNARFNEIEEKYKHLSEKAADLLALEETLNAASRKLEASEDHLKGTLSSSATLTELQKEVSLLTGIVAAMQGDQHASAHRLQSVNERFLNVTETWQGGLATVTEDLTTLRSESRSVHGRVTDRVNEAEEHLRALSKRLEELEDSTKSNGRVLERTEEDDAKNVQNQLDWNTKQVSRLQDQLALLTKRDVEHEEKLMEMEPQAKECQAQLPYIEDAVRSILRLGADLSGAERRLEELALQVVGAEDIMLKALAEILQLQRKLDGLQVENNVMKLRNELGDFPDDMNELNHVYKQDELDKRKEEPDRDEGRLNIKQLKDDLKAFKSNSFTDYSTSAGNEEIP